MTTNRKVCPKCKNAMHREVDGWLCYPAGCGDWLPIGTPTAKIDDQKKKSSACIDFKIVGENNKKAVAELLPTITEWSKSGLNQLDCLAKLEKMGVSMSICAYRRHLHSAQREAANNGT